MNEDARNQLRIPATALQVIAVLYVLGMLINVVMTATGTAAEWDYGRELPEAYRMLGLVIGSVLQVGIAALLFVGATRMKQLRSWGLCLAAAIAALLPCSCCCVLGIPFGIWAIIVLAKADVKEAFAG